MTVQANTMSTTDRPSVPNRRPDLPRWPSLTFLSTMLAAVVFALAYVVNRTISPAVLSVAETVGLGLVAGFAARYMLRGRAGLLRLLAALASVLVGQLLLGLLTRGAVGVGPLKTPLSAPDWRGLWHCALSMWSALLALYAWSLEQPAERRSLWHALKDAWARFTERIREAWDASALRRGMSWLGNKFARVRVWSSSPARARSGLQSASPTPRSAPAPASNSGQRSPAKANRRNGTGPHRLSRWRKAKRMAEIHLMGTEESRCPYCLDVVEPNDARGIVVCPTCRARHHADCWAITGMCQVPHHHAENHTAIH